MPETGLTPSVRLKLAEVTVAGSMAVEKVAVMAMSWRTFVDASMGKVVVTTGAPGTRVLKLHTSAVARCTPGTVVSATWVPIVMV